MKTVTFDSTEGSRSLARRYDYDEWIVTRFLHYVPQIDDFLEKMEEPNIEYIRVNSLKIDRQSLKEKLEQRGFRLRDTQVQDVLAVENAPHAVGATTEYLLGYYYLQDLSSCMSVVALDPQRDETCLDMCAAPGGKTTYIAQKMNNTGLLVAMESNTKRLNSVIFNLNRCGVINASVLRYDATEADKLGMLFDRILLDAPCTCEGIIPKDPGRKRSHSPGDTEFCQKRQVSLIESAIRAAKPGTVIVYATCSFAPEENEMVLDHVLHKYDMEVLPVEFGSEGLVRFGDLEFDPRVRNARRLYPHLHNTLGFFIAKIVTN